MCSMRIRAIRSRTTAAFLRAWSIVPLNLANWRGSVYANLAAGFGDFSVRVVRVFTGDRTSPNQTNLQRGSMVRKMNVADDDTGDDDTGDYRLIASAEDVFAFGKPRAAAEVRSVTAEILRPAEVIASKPHHTTTQVLLESPRPPVSPKPLLPRKELKSATELAGMIERDLAQHPDCPRNGFRVTVYGATHWRADVDDHDGGGPNSRPSAMARLD